MSGLGRYPLNIPALSDAFLGSSQRRDRLDYDYDDRRYRERERDRRDDDYRRDGGSRGRSSRDRYSPEPSYSSYDDRQDIISYPLGHLNTSRSDRGGSNRNDRNRNQNNRDRYRNNNNSRLQNNRGPSNQGPGILGAKPGDRTVPELPTNPLQVPGLGMTGAGLGSGLTAQLAQQQQQLMAMVQTQSLLAAMQAQANANAQAHVQRNKQGMPSAMGLLPTPLIPRNQSRDMQNRQNRKRGRNDNWGGGGNYGNKRERYDNNRRQQGGNRGYNQQNRSRPNQQSQPVKKAVTPVKEQKEKEAVEEEEQDNEAEEEETAEAEEETEEATSTQEEEKQVDEVVPRKPVEFNDRPLPKSVNFIGEDVDALMISLFDKKRSKYICQQCKIICNIPMSFYKHLLGKRHARTILEKQGKELDLEEFKNFSQENSSAKKLEVQVTPSGTKAEEKDKVVTPELPSPPAVQSPGSEANVDFVKYTCDTRKTAMKDGNIITISSVTQSRVRIDGFTSGRNMLGCEFVKAVSGFNCRLCKTFIRCGNDVINHIKGKKHHSNYKTYVQEHPQYQELQLARNKELENVLRPKEGEEVVLYEVLDKDIKTTSSKPRSRRKESQTDETDEVQVTKFVLASQSSDEADEMHCDAADLDVDLEGMDHVNEDSLLADESTEEHAEMGTTTDDDDLLYDPAEITGVDEDEEKQVLTTAQSEETEDFLPLSVDQPATKTEDLEGTEESSTVAATQAANQWKDQEPDTPDSSQEDTLTSPNVITPEVTPTPPKRAKKGAAKGGATRGRGARGRGRGRGTRRGGRASTAVGRAAKTKKSKADEDAGNNDDVNFMEGFEIIDEIGDGED